MKIVTSNNLTIFSKCKIKDSLHALIDFPIIESIYVRLYFPINLFLETSIKTRMYSHVINEQYKSSIKIL